MWKRTQAPGHAGTGLQSGIVHVSASSPCRLLTVKSLEMQTPPNLTPLLGDLPRLDCLDLVLNSRDIWTWSDRCSPPAFPKAGRPVKSHNRRRKVWHSTGSKHQSFLRGRWTLLCLQKIEGSSSSQAPRPPGSGYTMQSILINILAGALWTSCVSRLGLT